MNILQIEDDLKGMPTDVIVQHLQNPTGLIPTYLAAGELNRREKMQVARAEAPQETVVDEIIQKAMPMGGMPMPQPPMPQMPMPRPEEVMVSDTITETGIAGLPAPNVGNYKEGGIIGYQEGGEIEEEIEDYTAMEMLTEMVQEPDLVAEVGGSALLKAAGVASPYIKGAGLGALFYSPELGSAENPEFLAKMQEQQNFAKGGQVPGFFLGGLLSFGARNAKKIKDVYNKFKKKKRGRPKKRQQGAADKALLAGAGKAVDLGTTGIATGIAGAVRNPYTTAGLSALGYGIGEFFGESDEEKAARLAAADAKKAADNQAELDRMEKTRLKNQAALDEAQAKRDEANRRAYLALALGGAKTMAGQSPYALTNIGEGIGTGVAGLVELDEAAATRQSAKEIADAKIRQNLYEFNQERRLKIAEFRAELSENMDFRAAVDAQLEALGQDRTTIDGDTLVSIEEKVIMQFYPELGPTAGATMVAGETYAEV